MNTALHPAFCLCSMWWISRPTLSQPAKGVHGWAHSFNRCLTIDAISVAYLRGHVWRGKKIFGDELLERRFSHGWIACQHHLGDRSPAPCLARFNLSRVPGASNHPELLTMHASKASAFHPSLFATVVMASLKGVGTNKRMEASDKSFASSRWSLVSAWISLSQATMVLWTSLSPMPMHISVGWSKAWKAVSSSGPGFWSHCSRGRCSQ